MTKSDTRCDPPDSLPDEEGELVFIYGHQWHDGLLVGRTDPERIVGGGLVEGQLVAVGGHPVMIAVKGAGSVRGETYRLTRGQLEEFDKLLEGIMPPDVNSCCHRVRAMVRDVKLNHPPIEAWTWQWEIPEEQYPVVTSGDWLNPGLSPLFTIIAFCCLAAFPFIIVAETMMEVHFHRTPRALPFPSWVSWALLGLTFTSPMAGLYAAYLAHRRRERLSGCLLLIVIGLVVILLMLGVGLAKAL